MEEMLVDMENLLFFANAHNLLVSLVTVSSIQHAPETGISKFLNILSCFTRRRIIVLTLKCHILPHPPHKIHKPLQQAPPSAPNISDRAALVLVGRNLSKETNLKLSCEKHGGGENFCIKYEVTSVSSGGW